MGVYIPNMEKPKDCSECILADKHLNGLYEAKYYCRLEADSCPLIDIVTCEECKYMRKYALRSDEPTGIWCHRWSIPRLVTDDDFCSYGERKSDDNLRQSTLRP